MGRGKGAFLGGEGLECLRELAVAFPLMVPLRPREKASEATILAQLIEGDLDLVDVVAYEYTPALGRLLEVDGILCPLGMHVDRSQHVPSLSLKGFDQLTSDVSVGVQREATRHYLPVRRAM